jgi:hypothetical protein
MNDNMQNQVSSNTGFSTRREARRIYHMERRAYRGTRSGGGWIAGLLLMGLGVAFLLQNLGAFDLGDWLSNWWALFILIPAAGAFGNAAREYQANEGRLTSSARGSIIGGLILTSVATIFLFDLNWEYLGPALIILIGIGVLLNTLLPQ